MQRTSLQDIKNGISGIKIEENASSDYKNAKDYLKRSLTQMKLLILYHDRIREMILSELKLKVIWFNEPSEIPIILNQISNGIELDESEYVASHLKHLTVYFKKCFNIFISKNFKKN